MKPGLLLAAAVVLSAPAVEAAGVLRLTHNVITLGGDQPAAKLEAENTGTTPLYLDVSQEWVQTPVSQPEVRVPVGQVAAPSLLVSPPRLVLRPGQKRVLDVKVVRPPRETQIWRVTFRPRQRHRIVTSGESQGQAPLLVSVGYGVVIYQQGSNTSVPVARERSQ